MAEQLFLHVTHCRLDQTYMHSKYHQNIPKLIGVFECKSFPLKSSFKEDNSNGQQEEQKLLHMANLDLIYRYAKHHQNISSGKRVIECTSFPL